MGQYFLAVLYVNNRTAFSQNLLSDGIIHWRNWKKGERGDSYEHHTFLQIASHLRSPFLLGTGIIFCIARHDEAIVNGHAHNDMALS